ncbi:24904_t:CDS:1, partial [Gigaspora rosea]
EVEVDEWMSGFSDIVVNICIKLHNEECLEKFDWESVKNEYNCVDIKEDYIKNLASWVGQKAATIAKQRNCSIGDVNSKRAAYFLLRNYLINEDTPEKKYLKKYQ